MKKLYHLHDSIHATDENNLIQIMEFLADSADWYADIYPYNQKMIYLEEAEEVHYLDNSVTYSMNEFLTEVINAKQGGVYVTDGFTCVFSHDARRLFFHHLTATEVADFLTDENVDVSYLEGYVTDTDILATVAYIRTYGDSDL